MSLSNILKEIEKSRPDAEIDLQLGNLDTLNSRGGLKRAAMENIKYQKQLYRKELMSSALFIVATGPLGNTFSTVAGSEAFGCFSVDSEALYKELASKVDPKLLGREGVRGLFNIATNLLEYKALDLDIMSYPMLNFTEKYNRSVTDVNQLSQLLKEAINDQVGSEIVGLNAIHSLVDEALNRKHALDFTPIVLSTTDEDFALDLNKNLKRLTPNVFLVAAGRASRVLTKTPDVVKIVNVNEAGVGEALSTIRSRIKKL